MMPYWYPPILAYHRVHPVHTSDTPTLSPEVFEKQMRILSERWKPIPLALLVSFLDGKTSIPRRGVAVTFDDGTDDVFTFAFPILKKYRIPATIFMITNQMDKDGSLKKDELLEMSRSGIDIGSHTLGHAYLPSLTIEEAGRQISDSKKALETAGLPAKHFSYPAGGYSPAIVEAVRQAGYHSACTTNRGLHRFPIDRWALRRVTMHGNVGSVFGMWLRCSGYYNLNKRLRSPA